MVLRQCRGKGKVGVNIQLRGLAGNGTSIEHSISSQSQRRFVTHNALAKSYLNCLVRYPGYFFINYPYDS